MARFQINLDIDLSAPPPESLGMKKIVSKLFDIFHPNEQGMESPPKYEVFFVFFPL